ncbi:MAG: ABC transporter ATP-binding protein [Pseudomonadota bacterium]
MDQKFFSFVWRYSKRDQLIILALTILSFPLVYMSLEIPKIIINEAISGTNFPKNFFGLELEQIPYLLVLCCIFLLLVVSINGIKWLMNVQIGMTGERMLRRLRYMLFERVMRFRMQRFRQTKPGEVIQSILGEIEPLGGFIGEVIATPCFQGGLLVVYTTFIFMQDWVLGLAAISLYPIQAWIIPILQRKIVRLNKERAANTRVLADTIGETVSIVQDVHTNDTARWHMAQVAGRLYTNTMIRLDLYKRKFTIKLINNFMNQLTPFFFYSAGGYLVIKGDLDFGSLVAVLAAYKDVAAPWKAVLNYVQRWTDFNSRYVFVVESFSGDDVLPSDRIYAEGEDAAQLSGDLVFSSVEGGPGTGGLAVEDLTVSQGQMVAVVGGLGGGREALLKLAAGLQTPAAGRVSFGGEALVEANMAQVGATVAYVGAEPGVVARSMRENLLYGLFREKPELADQDMAAVANMLDEAKRTGNSTGNPDGDWVDYTAAGVDGPDELDARLMRLIDAVGLSRDLYSGALDMRLDAARAAEWDERVLIARRRLRDGGHDLSDLVEDWQLDRLNMNARLFENILYGLPVKVLPRLSDYQDEPVLYEVFETSGAIQELLEIGMDIAREFSELVDALEEGSSVLDSFEGYARADILAAHELVTVRGNRSDLEFSEAERRALLGLAFGFVPVRDRLDVLDDARVERLLACRVKARELLSGRDDVVGFDEDRFSPARRVAGNIVQGERRYDRKSAWKQLEDLMRSAVEEADLREDLIRLGLSAQLGSGSGLSSSERRRIGLVRGLMKCPSLVVLDGIAATISDSDCALRDAVRKDLPEATILYAAAEEGAAGGADLLASIADNGVVRVGPPSVQTT